MIDLGINLFQEIAALGGGGGFSITNSLRFNDNDSAYLSRTPSVAGNRKTWTWSAWVKRGNIGTRQIPFACQGASGHSFEIDASNKLNFYSTSGGASMNLIASPVLRDVAGWYHIILVADTTQATASDRFKFYVNGVQLTDFDTASYPSQNADLEINNNIPHNLGNRPTQSFYFDGYMAEVNFIDGQALTADDFGQIDATTGEWSPKAYEGTYGTNGFYLPFDGNANDDSGNGNNWTENNLASTDYMIDTPTNNFSVFNPLDNGGSTISNGNLEHTSTNTSWKSTRGTIAVNSGKWYWEGVFTAGGTTNADGIGFALGSASLTSYAGDNDSYGYLQSGATRADGVVNVTYGDSYTTNDIIGIALDLDAGTCTFYKNNASQGQAFSGLSGTFFPFSDTYNNSKWNLNFGADSSFAGNKTRQGNTDANGKGDFYYAPPAGGYLALCTDNLPAPAIEQPETQFNVVTYIGNSADRNIDLGFEADFVWIKRREIASQNCLFDRVRGNGQLLFSNLTNAEFNGVNDGIHFDYANGFNIDVGPNVSYYNETGGTYVAWCWKAGGTAVSNTDGSVTSQVSANVDAGFSIVSFTSAGGATIGHGLSQKPDIVIQKRRNSSSNWYVYYDFVDGSLDYLVLDTTAASGAWGGSAATPTTFYENWSSGSEIISYCFHSVEGFSKFGSYVGNGSTNGPFVYTGFKPAFVMVKCSSASSAATHWIMKDNMRAAEYNPASGNLYANLSNAEDTTSSLDVDLLSNGFKIRGNYGGTNASGETYIFMAFAEHPFKEALAR